MVLSCKLRDQALDGMSLGQRAPAELMMVGTQTLGIPGRVGCGH